MKPAKWLAASGVFCFIVIWLLQVRDRTPQPTRSAAAELPRTTSPTKAAPDPAVFRAVSASEWQNAAVADTEKPFARFAQWTTAYLAADEITRVALEARGVELAKARRAALASVIENDPERAFDLALPDSLREGLPASITKLLEERISSYGDYSVLAAIPLPDQKLNAPPVQRSINVDGREFQAFVYGHRRDAPSKRRLPVHGVALDDRIALHTSAVQMLEPETVAAMSAPAEQICGVAGTPLAAESVPVKVGSDIVWLCHDRHMSILREQLEDKAHQLAAAGGDGSISDTEETPYTEGRKRVVMIRVAFSNLPTPDITRDSLTNVHAAVDTFWRINSFGRTSLAELGRGSDIVQVTLSTNYQFYNDRAIPFRDDVRAAATAQGIDLGKFDFDIIYTGGGRPAFGFGGLGYVGGPGSWVVGASRGITCHELGHNLGFPHANFWDTGGQSAIGPGGNQEYGDPFDVMGGGGVDDGTGGGHYVSKFKWRIGWMLDADFPRVSGSATVRIYPHDNPDSRGIRGVRFRRDANLDYFLEFRQRYVNNGWLMNGIGLRWGSPGGSSSQLIDTTPGTTDGKNDSAIVIGRTFSDTNAQVHITPLGMANTYPPSMDVRVNIGAFPGNLPPIVSLSSSAESTGLGGPVVLSANASDPNNDALAYWWDLGDGTLIFSNTPVITASWRSTGEYKVRCVVSDMRGGTTSQSLIITVGSPATFTISGRVLYRGAPLANVFVRASSSRNAYTDSDGTYRITRLAPGNYTVTALLYPHTFVNPFFANPVAVGPADAQNIDFIAVDAPLNDVALVPLGAIWRYRDNGSDQGTAWTLPSFVDTSWALGAGELGYGDGDEATVLSFGSDANNKHITYYFRRAFNVADPSALTDYSLSLLRDDGGIVYLNGVEILRDNLPAGTVTYQTPAVDNSEDTTVINVDRSLFVAGQNVLAVEVHQVTGDSSDLSFNLSLLATTVTNFSGINAFYISQPANRQVFSSPADVPITASAFSMEDSYALVEFLEDGTKLGEDSNSPFTFQWTDAPSGLHRLTAVATLASGARLTSAPVEITVSAPVLTQMLIASNAVWRYNDENLDLGSAWSAPAYSDVTWSEGIAQLGFGDQGFATVIRQGSPQSPAYYFRKQFSLDDAALVTNLVANLMRDDGAIVYLNGTEVARVLMPTGSVTFQTLASAGVDNADETIPVVLSLPASLLRDGLNTVAVEIHQNSLSSSDARFGFELIGHLSAPPTPGVRITLPSPNSTLTVPDWLRLAATATGTDITTIEFYRDGTLLGEATSRPYRFDWVQPPLGPSALTAIAREAGGGSYTSAPVNVTLTAPPTGRQLVSPRSLWRYLDNGSDAGVTWRSRTFNDSIWAQGYARLGYGNDGESTAISYGPDPLKRYITTYFRHAFPVTTLSGISGLRLSISRDDAAVVYLNGSEIYRNNLAPGTVNYTSLASTTVSGSEETDFITVTLPASFLVAATNNVVAVEVHQDSLQSSDLGFDLSLVALSNTNLSDGVYLTAPADGARITLPENVQLAASTFSSSDVVNAVDFYAHQTLIAHDSTFPYEATWPSPVSGSYVLTAVAHAASGNQLTSPPVHVVVQGPPIMIAQTTATVCPFGASWKYWNNVTPPPSDWASASYSDSAWAEGLARFGFGLDGEVTTLPSGRITYYFRRAFNIPNPALIEELIFQLRRDDGAIVYINGLEAYRSNMPGGTVTATTLASVTADGLDEQQAFITTVPASGLVAGANIIAVEIHQSAQNSSDLGFDLHLTASGDTAPRVLLSRPGNGQAFVLPATINLEAAAWAGSGRAVSKVEFFTNGTRMAEAASVPYAIQWGDVPQGNHTLMARMTDNFGDVLQSRSVTISVGHQLIRTNFIAAGSVWKFRDRGSNEGTSFAQFTYNDAAWDSGPAQLGYGDADEATVVSFGPSSSSKYITTYFRRMFQNPAGWTITNISFRLLRDDGAVVWLNAREQFRSNMPGAAISYTTLASASVPDGSGETTYFESTFTITNLPANNLVAVEIHQSSGSSSDISFDLEVVGTGYVTPVLRPTLRITRLPDGSIQITWPANETGFTLYSTANLPTGWAASDEPVIISGNVHTVTIIPTGTAFYELRRP